MDRASVEAQDAVHWRDPKFRHFRDELDSALQQFERAQVRLESAGRGGAPTLAGAGVGAWPHSLVRSAW